MKKLHARERNLSCFLKPYETAGQLVASVTVSVIVIFISLTECCRLHAEETRRPNFVIIMADDLGYGDLSCFGEPGYRTPHLDRMASEGMRLTDFHSNGSVCSPTRAALLTGRYQQRAGIDGVVYADPKQNRHHGLQMEEITFAEKLERAGYKTGIFGKWHLGYDPRYNPVHSGFDQFRGYVSGNVCYQSHLDRMGIEDWWHDEKLTPEVGYTTHLITKHALQFIEQHRSEPFCVYVAHESVHAPFQGPDDPAVRKLGQVGEIRSAEVEDISRAYREMILEMDKGVGEILELLKKHQLAENTLVLFFSDNGAMRHGSNAPWKGFKGSLWEGGHRVPFIAWHPGKIEPGSVSKETALTMDIMPTMLDLAAIPAPSEKEMDGVSLRSVLYAQGKLDNRNLYWSYGRNWAVRSGDWKLVSEQKGQKPERQSLFNLQTDPQESTDVTTQFPERVRQMSTQFKDWQREIRRSATQQPGRS